MFYEFLEKAADRKIKFYNSFIMCKSSLSGFIRWLFAKRAANSATVLPIVRNDWTWPFAAYAITCYKQENRLQHYPAKNGRRQHSEDAATKHLKSLLVGKKLRSPSIKIYANYSPCHECSDKILKFLCAAKSEHRIDLKVELVFSNLYRVRRPSNEKNPHYRGRLPSRKEHEAQVEGLKKLQRHGVFLRPFTSQDWQDLAKTLGLNPLKVSCRENKCDLLKKDFEEIMGLHHIYITQPPLQTCTEENINKQGRQRKYSLLSCTTKARKFASDHKGQDFNV